LLSNRLSYNLFESTDKGNNTKLR